jgi:hypothetical protein
MKLADRQFIRSVSDEYMKCNPTDEDLALTEEQTYLTIDAIAEYNYAKERGRPITWQQAVKKAFRHNNHLAQVQEARHAKRAASRLSHPSHVESSK